MAYLGLGAVASPNSAFYFRPSRTQWQSNVTAAPKPVTTTAAPKPVTTTAAPKPVTITALPKPVEPVAVLVHPMAIDRVQPGMQPTAQTGGGPTSLATSLPMPQPVGGGPTSLSLTGPSGAASLDDLGSVTATGNAPSWLIPAGILAAVVLLSRSRHKRR